MPLRKHETPQNFGYVPDPAHARQRAAASVQLYGANPFADLPVNLDRGGYPYRAAAFVLQGNPGLVKKSGDSLELLALSQMNHGSCVGWGEARKILLTLAAGIFMRGLDLQWPTDSQGRPVRVSPSWSYGASREWNRGGWEGSNGSWAAKATQELGFLFELAYRGVDLSEYRTDDCNTWEARGVPRPSLQLAHAQRLEGYYRVEHCEQLAALYQNGYAVNVCGSHAPGGSRRDEYGAIPLTGRWAHSQTGCCYAPYRVGSKWVRNFGILNSHGSAKYSGGKGAKTPDLPGGAYMVSWDDMQMLLNEGDTWVNFETKGLLPAEDHYRKSARKKFGGNYALAI